MADNPFKQELERRQGFPVQQGGETRNPFADELARRELDVTPERTQLGAELALRQFQAGQQPREQALELGFRRFLNNIMAIPSATGEALAIGGAIPGTIADTVTGEGDSLGERFQQNLQAQQQQFPASALRSLPRPTTGDVIAGGQAAVDAAGNLVNLQAPNLGGEFAERQLQQQGRLQSLEQGPGGATGQIAGDVATLLTGRAPFSRARAPARRARREAAEAEFRDVAPELPEHINRQFRDVLTDKVAGLLRNRSSDIKRAAQRSAEAGLETATLALLNEDDPVTAAMLGSGAQAGGSLGLFLGEKPVKRLLPVVAGATVLTQMYKAVGPGERNIFESFDFAIDKSIAAIALGAAGAMAGSGRLRGPGAEQFPALFDAMTAIPRGAVQNRLREMNREVEAGNESPLRVLEILSSEPQRFNRDQLKALERSLYSEKSGAFVKEVERLKRNSPSFRESLNEAAGQPR